MNLLTDLFLSFARIGAFTFGGGYAMLSLLEHECVEKKQWLTEDEMAEVTVIAESTPGPIAINCATYTGLKLAGIKGAVYATLGMVLPSFFVLLIISAFLKKTPHKKSAIGFFAFFLILTLCSLLLAWHIPTILMILAAGIMGYILFSRKGAAK